MREMDVLNSMSGRSIGRWFLCGMRVSACLFAGILVVGIAQSPCDTRLFWNGGLVFELGVFSELSLRGWEMEEWRGFGGGPLIAASAFNHVGWDKISIGVESPWYYLLPLSTRRQESEALGGGGFSLAGIYAGYWFPVRPQVELQPVAGFWWMRTAARIEIYDPQTGSRHREVDYKDWQKGPSVGLSARLWRTSDSSTRRLRHPDFRMQYTLADLSEMVHMGRVEYKFWESWSKTKHGTKVSGYLTASIHLRPSITAVAAGIIFEFNLSDAFERKK